LEAILEAKKQKERIQAEQMQRSEIDPNPQIPVSRVWNGPSVTSTAGHKRKSMDGKAANPAANGSIPRKATKGLGHRRSHTIGGTVAATPIRRVSKPTASPSPPHLNSSALLGRSILLNRSTASELHGSFNSRRADATRTDYFRLKALGIDPDTPIFPDTKFSLERKRRRQDESANLTPRKRASTMSAPAKPKASGTEVESGIADGLAPRNVSAPEKSVSTPSAKKQKKAPVTSDDDDKFLRQIREVRAALTEDTEWFKNQGAEIEKEIVQQEEFRRSASQQSSAYSPPANSNSTGGLRRVNGYDYSPAINSSASQHSLSRTEQRIRATGAHGLATRPVSNYLPVAMSRSSRDALTGTQDTGTGSSNRYDQGRSKKRKGKRKLAERDTKYIYESDESDEQDVVDQELSGPVRARKRGISHHHRVSDMNGRFQPGEEDAEYEEQTSGMQARGAAASSNYGSLVADDELYDDEEEADDAEEGDGGYEYRPQNGTAEYEEEYEAEDDQDDEDGIDPESSEVGPTLHTVAHDHQATSNPKANPFHMRLRSATPEAHPSPGAMGGTQMSRATSGTGVSAEDALVLSD
jgi:hypothetical protein